MPARFAARSQLTLALCLALATTSSPTAAPACGNMYIDYYTISGARAQLDSAELALARGNLTTALRIAHNVVQISSEGTAVASITRAMRDAAETTQGRWMIHANEMAVDTTAVRTAPAAESNAITARARLLRGITIARMNGQLNSVLTPLVRATASQRNARFQMALADVNAALQASPSDPRAQAYVAEVRSRNDPSTGDAEARTTLRSLAQRDLLADAWSWALLSRLESDPATRAQHLARCQTIAGGNARSVCTR